LQRPLDLGAERLGGVPAPMGSSRKARASETWSAAPLATMSSACRGVRISPTVRVAMPASFLTRAATGTL